MCPAQGPLAPFQRAGLIRSKQITFAIMKIEGEIIARRAIALDRTAKS